MIVNNLDSQPIAFSDSVYSDVLISNAYAHESFTPGVHLAVSFMETFMSLHGRLDT